EFSVAERNEGIYLVRVSADGETETQRLVVTH
ncbi:MAG: T9SS type A sorting domain-containing protein, partial [Flavobacteriales bacterium]|nr:T9SS type A sorting domain-containing protein [Flavobacteriales bacterium]